MKKKVAVQGIVGSYHDIAARKYYEGEDIEILECNTFKDVVRSVRKDSSVTGLMAIENTIAGSLLPNHELIREKECVIVGECKLRISHTLSALPGTKLEEVEAIESHPIALMQCSDYLDTLPRAQRVETEDTAMSARRIAKERLKGRAAVCSRQAAEEYGLEILAEEIETNKRNYTRFLAIADRWRAE